MKAVILELFGLKKINLLSCFDTPPTVPMRDRRKSEIEEEIKTEGIEIAKLIREFVSAYLEQKEHTYFDTKNSAPIQSRNSFNPKNFVAPLIIVLEDIHKYDVYSFKVIRTLLKYFDNI